MEGKGQSSSYIAKVRRKRTNLLGKLVITIIAEGE